MARPADRTGLRATLLLLSLLPVFALPPASAQSDELHDLLFRYDMDFPVSFATAEVNGEGARFVGVFRDLSLDPPAVTVPNASPHSVTFRAEPASQAGWTLSLPAAFESFSNTETPLNLVAKVTPQATSPYFAFNVTAIIRSPDQQEDRITVPLVAYAPGIESFDLIVRPADAGFVAPREHYTAEVTVTSRALVPRYFAFRVTNNPCNQVVGIPDVVAVQPQSSTAATLEFLAPEDELFYVFGTLCQVTVEVTPLDNPEAITATVTVSSTVKGTSLDVPHFFWLGVVTLVVTLLVLLARRRNERRQEEIRGRPQKPWLIPVEQVYLKHLRQRDERAWYVVRHHLMEEEYRSAVLTWKSERKAFRDQDRKEALILKQEHRYEAWKARWQKRLARPLAQADRYEAALQRKLDRLARARFRKERRQVRKLTARMRKAHAKRLAREEEKWKKAVRKAERKGLSPPPRPQVPEPDYPPEPQLRPIPLASHRWAKKAKRHRARRVREQGDLEVRFERQEARYLHRVRRKAQRLAREVDDPHFVREHPLLMGDRPSS